MGGWEACCPWWALLASLKAIINLTTGLCSDRGSLLSMLCLYHSLSLQHFLEIADGQVLLLARVEMGMQVPLIILGEVLVTQLPIPLLVRNLSPSPSATLLSPPHLKPPNIERRGG